MCSLSKIEDGVIEKILERERRGWAKYGVTTERTDLDRRAWLEHAQEEALDLAIYLEKLISLEKQSKT